MSSGDVRIKLRVHLHELSLFVPWSIRVRSTTVIAMSIPTLSVLTLHVISFVIVTSITSAISIITVAIFIIRISFIVAVLLVPVPFIVTSVSRRRGRGTVSAIWGRRPVAILDRRVPLSWRIRISVTSVWWVSFPKISLTFVHVLPKTFHLMKTLSNCHTLDFRVYVTQPNSSTCILNTINKNNLIFRLTLKEGCR